MKLLIILLFEFFKVGMFAIGGGYATLPFLYQQSITYHWFSAKDLAQMLAIANIVPGPVGINLAAQVGFKADSFSGALLAVVGIMIPSFVFVFIIARLLKEFEGNKFVKAIFYTLKPASCGMIAAICFKLLKSSLLSNGGLSFASFDWLALLLLSVLLVLSIKKEHSPLFYLSISAFAGVVIFFFKMFIG